tara:strand:- start:4585 stop:4770 length:186 start_codon:yes stop_codon:yes gene_type:complete
MDLGSNIHEEHLDIFHKGSNNALKEFWEYQAVDHTIEQIMELDEYVGRVPPSVYLNQLKEQ